MRKKTYQKIINPLERALAIAVDSHSGQVDKGGHPYILHPIRMMLSLEKEEERILALLHDLIEDTEVTLSALESIGFSGEVISGLEALTRKPGETRMQAARRIKKNPLARAVKLADLKDNMDLSRISEPGEGDFARIREYEKVMTLLKEEEFDQEGP